MTTLTITKLNEVHMHIDSDDISALYELHDYFSFFVPGYKFHAKFRAGYWDGKIRLFHLGVKRLPLGLFAKVNEFANKRGYSVETDGQFADNDVSFKSVLRFLDELNLPAQYKPREYQIKSFLKCIRKGRLLLLSPTSSGKSLIIYLILRWFNVKTLIIVPNISLTNQMANDFYDYGYEEEIHKIFGGQDKYSEEMVTISTWQSIAPLKKGGKEALSDYMNQYDLIIGDEAHMAKAAEFTTIMEAATDVPYRFGTTGTLDDSKTNPIIIQGHFGEIYQNVTTKELMDAGHVADLTIKTLVLSYPDTDRKLVAGSKYQEEIDWLCANQKRNVFIKNLAAGLEGNVLILFNYVEKHGRVLEELMRESITDRPIYWISGATDGEEREEIRKVVDTNDKSILLASIKTSGTGVSIRNINHIIFVSPSKAKIQTLQNIGRGLRKSDKKSKVTLYDIADDLQWKKKENYTLGHFRDRIKIYAKEQFKIKSYNIKLK